MRFTTLVRIRFTHDMPNSIARLKSFRFTLAKLCRTVGDNRARPTTRKINLANFAAACANITTNTDNRYDSENFKRGLFNSLE